MGRSILTEKTPRRGRHILQEYTVVPLDLTQAGQLMTPEPATLPGTMPVAAALAFFREGAEHRSYPVVAEQGLLLGLDSRTAALRGPGSDYPASATLAENRSRDSQPFASPA